MGTTSASDVFRAVMDPTRRSLLDLLRDGQQPAGAIADRFSTTASAISQHLKVLLDAGLVRRRREGRQQIYSLDPAPLRAVADWVQPYEVFWGEKLDSLGAYLDKNAAHGRRSK